MRRPVQSTVSVGWSLVVKSNVLKRHSPDTAKLTGPAQSLKAVPANEPSKSSRILACFHQVVPVK